MANLKPSESRIPDAKSVKLTFLLVLTFYLTKTQNRTKKLLHSSHTISLSKGIVFTKKTNLLRKNADMSKIGP